ncbi:MAG: DUF3891 family protein [bacterium]
MIITPHEGSLLLVFQHDHALLAGRLASAWRAEFIAHRDRRGEVLEAVALHDAGWQEADARGVLDTSTGRPASVLSLPLKAYPPIWDSSIEQAARWGPLAGYLVARHLVDRSAGMGRPSEIDSEGPAALQAFKEEAGRTIARLAEGISSPPISPPYPLAETAVENDFRFLQLNDILSLALCGGHGTPFLTFLRASTLGGKPLEAEIPEPFSLRLAPWVFEPDRLEDAVPVRAIPDRAYPDQEALSDAIAQAAVTEQPILIKPL